MNFHDFEYQIGVGIEDDTNTVTVRFGGEHTVFSITDIPHPNPDYEYDNEADEERATDSEYYDKQIRECIHAKGEVPIYFDDGEFKYADAISDDIQSKLIYQVRDTQLAAIICYASNVRFKIAKKDIMQLHLFNVAASLQKA